MKQFPYNVRLLIQLLLFILLTFIVVEGQTIFVPLYFSILIAILLLPVAVFLEKTGMPRALSAFLSTIIALVVVVGIIYLFSAQIITFLNDIPSLKIHLQEHYQTLQDWLKIRFNISLSDQENLMQSATARVQSSGLIYIRQTFYTAAQTFAFTIFIVIFAFLMLYYRTTIKKFLMVLFKNEETSDIEAVIMDTKKVLKSYMVGLLIEMAIICTSNFIVLMLTGIRYALFLAVLTAVLNIMPFIGIYSGILFTVLVSLTTDASMSQIAWVVFGLLAVHFADTNFIMPRIVGSKVKINALITIIGALAGGLLIGISGVFLALPTIAILKILFDRIQGMEAWAILLGDETAFPGKKFVQKINKKLSLRKLSKPTTEA